MQACVKVCSRQPERTLSQSWLYHIDAAASDSENLHSIETRPDSLIDYAFLEAPHEDRQHQEPLATPLRSLSKTPREQAIEAMEQERQMKDKLGVGGGFGGCVASKADAVDQHFWNSPNVGPLN